MVCFVEVYWLSRGQNCEYGYMIFGRFDDGKLRDYILYSKRKNREKVEIKDLLKKYYEEIINEMIEIKLLIQIID